MAMTWTRIALPLTVGVTSVLLTACGSSSSSTQSPASQSSPATATGSPSVTDTSTTAVAAKAALKASLLSSLASQSPPIPYDAAGGQCVADRVVDHLGMAKLEKVGLNHEFSGSMTLSADDATYLATQLVDCAPSNSIVQFFRQRLNDGMGAKANDTQKACMDGLITRDLSIKLLTSEYDGQAAAGQASFQSVLASAAPGCGLR